VFAQPVSASPLGSIRRLRGDAVSSCEWTTSWHVHEIQNLLRKTNLEIVGLMADASLETLMRLTALPEGTKNEGGLEMLRQRLARLTASLPAQEAPRGRR